MLFRYEKIQKLLQTTLDSKLETTGGGAVWPDVEIGSSQNFPKSAKK